MFTRFSSYLKNLFPFFWVKSETFLFVLFQLLFLLSILLTWLLLMRYLLKGLWSQ